MEVKYPGSAAKFIIVLMAIKHYVYTENKTKGVCYKDVLSKWESRAIFKISVFLFYVLI